MLLLRLMNNVIMLMLFEILNVLELVYDALRSIDTLLQPIYPVI